MKAELKTPSQLDRNPTSELIFHEERALRHLRRETRRTIRAALLLGARALRLIALLFERVEPVREVGPGLRPLTRVEWETQVGPKPLY